MAFTANERKVKERAKRAARGEKQFWLTPMEQEIIEAYRENSLQITFKKGRGGRGAYPPYGDFD